MNKEIQADKKISEVKNIAIELDINKIVKRAQESYDKKDVGLAKQLSTGKTILRPTEDKDFVLWTKGDHWFQLTHLKGLPFGRVVQISGKPDSGKSTHAMSFMKFAQDQNVLVILWDTEKKFSSNRFDTKIGGRSDKLLVVNTNNLIEGADAVAKFVHAAKETMPSIKVLLVWDSAGASLNSTESGEEEKYSNQPGVSAKQTSYAIKKFNKLINQYMDKTTGEETISVLVINQTYASIGMGVSVQIEKGGGELYYLSSVIVQLSRKQDLTRVKQGDKYKFGIVSRAKIKKNHLFEGDECIAEMDIVVSADGIHLAKDVKKFDDIKGWDEKDDEGE